MKLASHTPSLLHEIKDDSFEDESSSSLRSSEKKTRQNQSGENNALLNP